MLIARLDPVGNQLYAFIKKQGIDTP